jgi:hypothetical protein
MDPLQITTLSTNVLQVLSVLTVVLESMALRNALVVNTVLPEEAPAV